MAIGAIRARILGDDFQGRLFWFYAAKLFLPNRRVSRVQIEAVGGGALDDIVVDYSPYIEEGGTHFTREYIQCKFHVAEDKIYSSRALCDPALFSTTESFLRRAFSAYSKLAAEGVSFMLVLSSNADWDPTDKLRSVIDTGSGCLRDRFFTDGPRSDLGKIRNYWCDHLGISEDEAAPFFRSLRLKYRMLASRELLELIDMSLQRIGLEPIDSAKPHNSYDGVYREMLKSGTAEFDRDSFRSLCESAGLGTPREPSIQSVQMAGIRSFILGSSYMDLECDPLLCLCEYFDGRLVRDSASWNSVILDGLREWAASIVSLPEACELRLECHCSVATAAGSAIGPRPRSRVAPAQGSKMGGSTVWDRDDGSDRVEWSKRDLVVSDSGADVAVALAITHDIADTVATFLADHPELSISTLRVYSPVEGAGHHAVPGGHAGWLLAEELAADMAGLASECGAATTHIFTSAPNALNFLMGRMKRPGDPWQTWEHNADGSLPERYVEAIRIQ